MVTIGETQLTIREIVSVAHGSKVKISDDPAVVGRVEASREIIARAVAERRQIYGVTTLFGGMADVQVKPERLGELQKVALWQHKSTTGPRLSDTEVRAAMLLRANSLMRGVSGIRLEIIERYATFLNAGATPHVHRRGSIRAEVEIWCRCPTSLRCNSWTGSGFQGRSQRRDAGLASGAAPAGPGAADAAAERGAGPQQRYGAVCTGVAAICVDRAMDLVAASLGLHALFAQALHATQQSFHPFIHVHKPHPGQVWTARTMTAILDGSSLLRAEPSAGQSRRAGEPHPGPLACFCCSSRSISALSSMR